MSLSGADLPRDEELVRLIQSRDQEGMRRLLEACGERVKGLLVRKFGKGRATAVEDAMSVATWSIWQHIDRYDPAKGSLAGWFLTASRNALIGFLRAEKVRPLITLAGAAELEDLAVRNGRPEPLSVQAVRRAEDLVDCLSKLQARQQDILMADLHEGCSADASVLAKRWNTTPNAIRVCRHKAHQKLRDMLKRRGW